MEEITTKWLRAIRNPVRGDSGPPDFLSPEATANVRRVHQELACYQPTPLVRLDGMAKALGVRAVFVKDESRRFGLKAFKGLGGLYAVACAVCRELGLDLERVSFSDLQDPKLRERVEKLAFVTATDGNHGKGVAWAASQLGCKAYVYMPRGSSELRAKAIRDAGGTRVEILDLSYDGAVRYAAGMAEENGWHLIQDTSWDGYEEIPRRIIQGYTTMAAEAAGQLAAQGFDRPSHVFLQAGVGAMAGGVLGFLLHRWRERPPVFSIVEPENAACVYRSAAAVDGAPHPAAGSGVTIMAGLNCGEPCTIAWPILRDFADWYFTCPDWAAAYGMRLLGAPEPGDAQVISGESGAVTTGLLNLLRRRDCSGLAEKMGLDENAVVLLFNTEGDTDPVQYRQIVHEGKLAVPD